MNNFLKFKHLAIRIDSKFIIHNLKFKYSVSQSF